MSKKPIFTDDFDLSAKRKDSPRRAAARNAAKEIKRVRIEQHRGQVNTSRNDYEDS